MGAINELPARVRVSRHRLTVEQYHQMAQVGVLAPDARVELIEGQIIDRAPIGTGHWSAVNRLNQTLVSALQARAIVSVQSPIRLGDFSEPEPDLAVFRYQPDFYAERLPTGDDALLAIEVADTTAPYDRGVKLPLYAKHGIPEVWIVDLEALRLCCFRRPQGDRYLELTETDRPGPTPLAALPSATVDLSGVF